MTGVQGSSRSGKSAATSLRCIMSLIVLCMRDVCVSDVCVCDVCVCYTVFYRVVAWDLGNRNSDPYPLFLIANKDLYIIPYNCDYIVQSPIFCKCANCFMSILLSLLANMLLKIHFYLSLWPSAT